MSQSGETRALIKQSAVNAPAKVLQPPAPISEFQEELSDIEAQLESANRFGHRLGGASGDGGKPPMIQAKLTVGPANDEYEQEADQVADRIMRKSDSYPYKNRIENAFQESLPGHMLVDPLGCAERGVAAFTNRKMVHFASSSPPLNVAAHEAVHLLQHAGRTSDAQLGPEAHAQMVAQLIVQGMPAKHMLGSKGSSVDNAIHAYTEIGVANQKKNNWKVGKPLRVSEDGKIAVAEVSTPNHHLWAMPSLVSASNSILDANKSVIKLSISSETLKGKAPDGSGSHTLRRVIPENKANGTSGDTMKLWADCGKSCRDVVGVGEGTGWNSEKMTARYTGVAGSETTAASDPEHMKNEIFNAKLGGTGDEGLHKYEALSSSEKDQFDKETGINRYTMPGVGQGYTMSSGGNPAGPMTWNFHWAGVIMASGNDRVALENYSVSDPSVQNSRWRFEMYGSAAKTGQTFYEQHKASGQHGDMPTAMEVEER